MKWDLPKGLILLCGDGHSWVALDYRNTKSDPPVIFIDTETDELIKLANNFAAFLENFTEHEKVSKKANKKKYIFTDIRFNVEIDKKDPMDSIMNIELYCDEEVKYKYNGNILENFTNKVIPRKSLFIKWLEIVEKFFNEDGEVHISVNDYEKTLILKHNKNKDHLIIKENRRILGYYPEIKGFFQSFNNQLLLAKEKIKESKISKDF
ncbi:SMI1/KNR4 family protein [Peribacillus butanolivorans]|uniref:SMI1/KNR4 family protein n=1 Tax=Peribacillus butanolivorans TaxID=421767 RepID=UPI00366C6A84